MRFGDSRVQALARALCVTLCAVTGITNRSLRALMTGLLSAPCSMAQASYDLARLRLQRPDHPPPARQHLPPDPHGSWHSRILRHQGPRPGSWPRCSPPGSPRPRPSSALPSRQSNITSMNDSPTPTCRLRQPEKLGSTVRVIDPKGRQRVARRRRCRRRSREWPSPVPRGPLRCVVAGAVELHGADVRRRGLCHGAGREWAAAGSDRQHGHVQPGEFCEGSDLGASLEHRPVEAGRAAPAVHDVRKCGRTRRSRLR